ncbi:hypothetical protein HMPREF0972_00340 [Actinomyces sp. oral taxon 848 str. F0332]|nr:hypothetical protein HMPREF0972_00340 [Actinomyces sp. oral taxon 848 str. F0332]
MCARTAYGSFSFSFREDLASRPPYCFTVCNKLRTESLATSPQK